MALVQLGAHISHRSWTVSVFGMKSLKISKNRRSKKAASHGYGFSCTSKNKVYFCLIRPSRYG